MKRSRVELEQAKGMIDSAKVFLFDFDGTLVNLDKLNVDGFSLVFKEMFDLDFTRADFMKYISGRGSENGLREYLGVHGIKDFSSKELNDRFYVHKNRLIEEKLEEEVYLLPGIKEFLEHFKDSGKRNIVVTSSRREHVERMLTYFGVYNHFEIVFDRYNVVKGKPDPEPFEKAMVYAKIQKEECVAFEDSFYGLQSSKGAGLFTIGVLNDGWNDDFVYTLADYVIGKYTDLI